MLFPIIKVKDLDNNKTHIVGTNIHDQLIVNSGKSITYSNLQNGEGSQFGPYMFEGEECLYQGVTVEFVTLDELMNIYSNQCNLDRYHKQQLDILISLLQPSE
ncbi:hypothetical protein [Cytobacillus purgationiresistens]|uniref:DUF4176 domain-containing protein n=1 Tax=Cytobacillus purgationiresistens TaxID=863449 RepID=A0ABU0APY9_9BACI|nr:hypothetical protein [Cytobacillus purgationiresistens]MDQ0273344.1 hypothetical protein [Cytobacillus purgationiresistens]